MRQIGFCAIIIGMSVVPYENVKSALVEYISFMLNISEYGCGASDVEKTDRKRRALHDRVVEAFGFEKDYYYREDVFTFSVEKIASAYEPYVDDSKDVDWLSKYVYDYISDRLRDVDNSCLLKTNRRLTHYGPHNLDNIMKKYDEFLSECESILKEWDSVREKYNDSISTSGKEKEWTSFWHEVNGAKSAVRRYEKTVRELLSMPSEAYTEAAVKKYWDEPLAKIVEMKKKIAYEAIRCQIYMKNFKRDNKITENN